MDIDIDIPEPIRKGIAGSKNKIVSLCKTNTHLKKTVHRRRKKRSKTKNTKH